MTSVSWEDDGQQEVTASSSTVRWKGRTLVNFAVGRSRVRALPVVIHFLPEDIGWFSSVSEFIPRTVSDVDYLFIDGRKGCSPPGGGLIEIFSAVV